jgi:hypothetical protein
LSVDQPDIVDVISIDQNAGQVTLTISDHLDWSDSIQHQTILQAKLNRYLAFVESEEILKPYPAAKNMPIAFKIVFRVRPDSGGFKFLNEASKMIESEGFTLRYEIFAESYDN